MSRSVTLKDIARETGLSIAAVSKALNGYRNVSEVTRRRVVEASDRLGYERRARANSPNGEPTRGLRMGLVLIEERSDADYVNRWVTGVTRTAKRHGVRVELDQIGDQHTAGCEQELRRLARSLGGLLLFGYIKSRVLRLIRQLRVPIVVVGDAEPMQPRPEHQVSTDTQGMGWFATRTLLSAGHRRIAFLCPESPPGGWTDHWLAGYQMAMLRSGLEFDPALVGVFPRRTVRRELGLEAAAHIDSLREPATAFVMPERHVASSLRHVLAERGGKIRPERMIVGGTPESAIDAGLDGHPLLSESTDDGAAHALDMLLRLHQGTTIAPGRIIVPYLTHNFHLFKESGSPVQMV